MTWAVAAAVACAVFLPSAASAGSHAPAAKPRMVVIGDSMSALASTPRAAGGFIYADIPDVTQQAWWSILRRDTGYRAAVFAEAGSGWNKPGRGCSLTAFADRVQQPAVRAQLAQAQLVVVLGGVNDRMACSQQRTLEQAMDQTLAAISEAAPTARVVVGSPYTTTATDVAHRVEVITTLKRVAASRGAIYVGLPLTREQTRDGTHPNRVGTHLLAERVRHAAGLVRTPAAIAKAVHDKKIAAAKAKKAAAAKKAADAKAKAKKKKAKKLHH